MTELPPPLPAASAPSPEEQTFISHLIELRSRLLRAILCVVLVLCALMPFQNAIYEWLSKPLLAQMQRTGAQMIATEVASPFLAPLKLSTFVAVAISVPYILYQVWAFIAPGLYQHERRFAVPLLCSATLLFYSGMAFAYFGIFPRLFAFLTSMAPAGVTVMTDINQYLDFVLKLFFAFGCAFEVPVATFLLVKAGIATRESLAAKRPYVIVAAFVAGALLTPDVFSQVSLAVPIWLLYEAGLVCCRIFIKPDAEDETTEAGSTPGGPPATS